MPSGVYWLLLICFISMLGMGCPTAVQYQPDAGVVDTLGLPQAQARMKDTLLRSINPRIMEVDVTDDFLRYGYQQQIPGPWGIPMGPMPGLVMNQVAFLNVGRVEVFPNNLVFVRTSSDIVIAQVVFGNEQDAKMFADLMISFRDRRSRSAR